MQLKKDDVNTTGLNTSRSAMRAECRGSLRPRVCLIDNDEAAIEDIARILEASGYDVLCLDRIIGASNNIRLYKPDLVLINVQMPSLPGPQLVGVLKRNIKKMPPFIFFGDLDEEALESMAQTSGAEGYVMKNGSYVHLLSRIKFHLSQSEKARSANLAEDFQSGA